MITEPVPVSPHDAPKPRRPRQSTRSLSREPALDLVGLRQQREPEPGHAGLVRDQLPVTLDQRSRTEQLGRLPVGPHPGHPSRSAATERGSPTTIRNQNRLPAGMPPWRPRRTEPYKQQLAATVPLTVARGVPGRVRRCHFRGVLSCRMGCR